MEKKKLLMRQKTRASLSLVNAPDAPQINEVDDIDFSDVTENWGNKDKEIHLSLSGAIALNGVHVRT